MLFPLQTVVTRCLVLCCCLTTTLTDRCVVFWDMFNQWSVNQWINQSVYQNRDLVNNYRLYKWVSSLILTWIIIIINKSYQLNGLLVFVTISNEQLQEHIMNIFDGLLFLLFQFLPGFFQCCFRTLDERSLWQSSSTTWRTWTTENSFRRNF